MLPMAPSGLLELPAELRARIYVDAFQFDRTLCRPVRAEAWRDFTGYVTNLSLLTTCKLIYRESKDVFYDINKFEISYNHLCTCENQFPFPTLNERMRDITISGYLPRIDQERPCRLCRFTDRGSGLFDYLSTLPRLKSVDVLFEHETDWDSGILYRIIHYQNCALEAPKIGVLRVKGLPFQLRLLLSTLYLAWHHLAGDPDQGSVGSKRYPGERSTRHALEYLQFEANTYDRTAQSLLRFFLPIDVDNPSASVLRFKGLPDELRRRADFTIELAAELNAIFSDGGGSETIRWTEIDGMMYNGRWSFSDEEDG
ncbi:hypothetical protein BAUCODRAFT_517575 [Baudoinia panamericana UAMH 10762]|uniref:F-box domain-containing protein n=1 Tax=Baudoinia panamericana (strain UAMH 10762) TaxID=717646 RepID=M2LNZ3_BAUPA|nr:uncharacterized protein BAUCODRAFT_517575 [Baudoinia panamericana UAMH 10762]EMC96097.1 hypothetical protein BAUCODRAFT_517575 [Baudoinia panamericana UAMH 10762]